MIARHFPQYGNPPTIMMSQLSASRRARLCSTSVAQQNYLHVRHMFDLSCCANWQAKTKKFLLQKWRLENSRISTPFTSSRRNLTKYFSEKVQEIPSKTQRSVKTIRLSENWFIHDFSDFSDPERKISYAREMAHTESDEEICVVVSINVRFHCKKHFDIG